MGLTWTPSTVVVALVIAVLAVLALHRMITRGLCDCHDHCGDSSSKSSGCGCSCTSCAGCASVDKMVENVNRNLEK